jgi:hypothetical protein
MPLVDSGILGPLDDPAALYGQAEQPGRRHGMHGDRDRDAWAEAYTRVTHAMSRGRGP